MNSVYISKDGNRLGPYTESQVLEMLGSKMLAPTDQVWKSEDQGWMPVAHLLPAEATLTLWHYSINGVRHGPVSDGDLHDLIQRKVVNNETFVWKDGFSAWVPLGQTSMKAAAAGPPPLTAEAIGSGFVWLIVFAPILGTLLQYPLGSLLSTTPSDLWGVPVLLNLVFSFIDLNRLKQGGHDTARFGGWAFFIPVYLFRRAKALNQSLLHFGMWIGAFLFSLIL